MTTAHDAPAAAAAMGAALAEVGIEVTWEDGRWIVPFDADPRAVWRASNLVAPLMGEEPISYDEWAAWHLAERPRTELERQWLDRGRR